MNLISDITQNNECACVETASILTTAFRDHCLSIDQKLADMTSVTKSKEAPEIPITRHQNHLFNYITKGTAYSTQGGYAILPEIDFINGPEYKSLVRSLAHNIHQDGGLEHKILQMSDQAFIRNPTGEIDLVNPTSVSLTLEKLELGLFLRSEVTSNTPSNFESIVKHALYRQFAQFENDLFLSDAGVEGKIQGIGSLDSEGFKHITSQYDGKANTLYDLLRRQVISMMEPEYLSNCVWLMSPQMFNAISSILDMNGNPIFGNEQKNLNLFGFPVHCDERFNKTKHQIIFANVKEGYVFVSHPNILALHDNYRNRDGITHYFTRLVAGAVTNKSPWVSVRIEGLPEKDGQMSLDELRFAFAKS